jgi:hypothetical protein
MLESREGVVERDGHIIEFVVSAAERESPPEIDPGSMRSRTTAS